MAKRRCGDALAFAFLRQRSQRVTRVRVVGGVSADVARDHARARLGDRARRFRRKSPNLCAWPTVGLSRGWIRGSESNRSAHRRGASSILAEYLIEAGGAGTIVTGKSIAARTAMIHSLIATAITKPPHVPIARDPYRGRMEFTTWAHLS